MLEAIQECISRRLPLLALLAGTPGLPDHLRQMGATHWERASQWPVGRLESDEEVRAALSTPASQSGLPIDEDAPELLVRESQRHPFFVQLVGSAA